MLSIFRAQGPFAHRNVRLFAFFTVLYNARAYYPIFTILLLDLGLSREAFLTLNAVWAATILLLEVPSGALADLIGRRRLLIASAIMMVLEMALLLLAPQNGGALLIVMVLANRLLSGASEAAASGADQAIAYDTLKKENQSSLWDETLAAVMSLRSLCFFVAMILGALLYDPSLFSTLFPSLASVESSFTLRLPLALVFLQGLVCLSLALRMKDPELSIATSERERLTTKQAFRQTFTATRWLIVTPAAILVIVGGMLADSFARTFATLASDYYRILSLPEWSFGFIGALIGVIGIFVPKFAAKLNKKFSPRTHLLIIISWAFLALAVLGQCWPYYGIIPAILTVSVLSWTNFLVSTELNRLASSEHRATILSVKGLAFNLSYGTVSLSFAGAIALAEGKWFGEEQAFQAVLRWQPLALLLGLAGFFFFSKKLVDHSPHEEEQT